MAGTILSNSSIQNIDNALQIMFQSSVNVGFIKALDEYKQPNLQGELMPFHDKIIDLSSSDAAMVEVDEETMNLACDCYDKLIKLQTDIVDSGILTQDSEESAAARRTVVAVRPVTQALKAHVEKFREPSLARASEESS